MSEPKFTSGPWELIMPRIARHGAADHESIAFFGHQRGPIDDESNQANASLIIAAPDLYEALDQLVTAINSSSPKSLSEIETANQNAIAALTKARGEEANG